LTHGATAQGGVQSAFTVTRLAEDRAYLTSAAASRQMDWDVLARAPGAVSLSDVTEEAVDLAMAMARTYTGNLDLLALRTAYHGPTAAAQSITGISGWRHPGMPGNVAFVAAPVPVGV